jgi:hypothetical protein
VIDRNTVKEDLCKLNPSQIEDIIYNLQVDKTCIRMNGTTLQIVLDLIGMLKTQEDLERLQEIINTVKSLETADKLQLSTYWQTRKLDFVGREKAIQNIKDLVENKGAKVIVIQAIGGIGKTTLAEQYFVSQGHRFLQVNIAQDVEAVSSAAEVIADWLQYNFQVKPIPEKFDDKLSLLCGKLKRNTQEFGIIINNLESVLKQDGSFRDDRNDYAKLLRVLADPSIKTLTLITSRELLNLKPSIDNIKPYHLEDLSPEAWQEFFKFEELNIPEKSQVLKDICEAYGGNALAMEIISAEVKEYQEEHQKQYKEEHQEDCPQHILHESLNQFWQENKESLLENSEDERLKDLIKHQFDRLETLDGDAYRLLCRLGCYRYQDIPTLTKEGLSCLLWDISEKARPINVIKSLRSRRLIDKKYDLTDNKYKYSIHPVIREESHLRLKSNKQEWRDTNISIAEFYLKVSEKVATRDQAKAAFEAIDHYFEIGYFEKCHRILLHILDAEENLENLRCSENLWLYINKIETYNKIIDKLDGLTKAITLIPLGFLYPEIGKTNKAIDISQNILEITKEIVRSNNVLEQDLDREKLMFAQVSAHLISGRANKFIGNFPEALKACENAIECAKNTHIIMKKSMPYWEALALYELGTVHLEKAIVIESSSEAWKAFITIFYSGLLAITPKIDRISIIRDVSGLFRPIRATDLQAKVEIIIDRLNIIIRNVFVQKTNESRDDDYTKQFRILYNLGRCLNVMRFLPGRQFFQRALLDIALDIVLKQAKKNPLKTDYLNTAWSYLELALCASDNGKKESNYSEAYKLFDKTTILCKASILFEYGKFKYKTGHYQDAMEKHLELKIQLEGTGFELLKVRNYCNICSIYLKLDDRERREKNTIIAEVLDELEYLKNFFDDKDLPYIDKKIRKIQTAMNR